MSSKIIHPERLKNYRGFTIVELLIVIVVIAILAAITTVVYNGVTRSAHTSSTKSTLRSSANKIMSSYSQNGAYPDTLTSEFDTSTANATLRYTPVEGGFCLQATSTKIQSLIFNISHDGVLRDGVCPPIWIAMESSNYPGNDSVMAVASDGRVFAWGSNNSGQLGDGTTTSRDTPVDISQSGSIAGKTVKQVWLANQASYALASDNTLHAWGLGNYGQVGDGNPSFSRYRPVDITSSGSLSGKTIKQVAAGSAFVLALATDGTIHAWGQNTQSQLGNGSTTYSPVPVNISSFGSLSGKTIVLIAAGTASGYALASDGTLHSWGMNTDSQLATGDTTNRTTPVNISAAGSLSGKATKYVTAGERSAFVLATDGTVHAWGKNTNSQLGDGSTTDRSLPVDITSSGTLSGRSVTTIRAGGAAGYALTSANVLHAWGYNSDGALGNGTTNATTRPVVTGTTGSLAGKTITKIIAGSRTAFAIASDGTLHAWGSDQNGQLGNGATTANQPTPLLVALPSL